MVKKVTPTIDTNLDLVDVDYGQKNSLLVSLLSRKQSVSILVVFLSNAEIQFYTELLIHLKLSNLTGDQQQNFTLKSQDDLKTLSNVPQLILFMSPPSQIEPNLRGSQINVLLLPHEQHFRKIYTDLGYNIQNSSFKQSQLSVLSQEKLFVLAEKNYLLYSSAVMAYRDHVSKYQQGQHFQFDKINPYQLCQVFGFRVPPKVKNYVLKKPSDYVQNSKTQKKEVGVKKSISKRALKRVKHRQNKQKQTI